MAGDLVTVESYPDPITANLARNRLEEAGIRAVLSGEELVGISWGFPGAIGGIKLLVMEEDATRAVLLLADPASEAPPPPEEREGIQADPPPALDTRLQIDAPEPGEEPDGPEDEEPHVTHLDATAARAYKAALFGLFFFPLSFYAIYLVLDVTSSDEQLTARGRRDLGYALLFLSPYFLVIAAIGFAIAFNLANP